MLIRYFLALIVAFALFSCGQHIELKEVAGSLERSTRAVEEMNHRIYASLQQKLADPMNRDRAERYVPRALTTHRLSAQLVSFVDSAAEPSALTELLEAYRKAITASLDSLAAGNVKDSLPIFDRKYVRGVDISNPVWRQLLKNDIRVSENRLITYYDEAAVEKVLDGNAIWPEVYLSTNYVQPGQPIEVFAGVGRFPYWPKTRVLIDGKPVDMGNAPYAQDTIKAPSKPGKYKILVEIQMTKPDGSTATCDKNCTYTVAASHPH